MRTQVLNEMDKQNMTKAQAKLFIQSADISARQGKQMMSVLSNQLDKLNVMSADESNEAITTLKKHVQDTYDRELSIANQTNGMLSKAVRIKLSEELFDLNLTKEDADTVNNILEEHELLRPDDPDFKEAKGLIDNVVKLKAKISKNYIGAVNNTREKLIPHTNPNKNTVVYNNKAYKEDGRLVEDQGVMTIINKNVEAADNIITITQQNGLDITSNWFRYNQLHYGGLYDEVADKIPEDFRQIDMSELLIEINEKSKPSRSLGRKESPIDSQLKRMSEDILNVQLENAYKKAWNSSVKAAQEAGDDAVSFGKFKKDIKEDLLNELNISDADKIGKLNKIDELENLQKLYDQDFTIKGEYKQLAELKKSVNKELRSAIASGDRGKVEQLEEARAAIQKREGVFFDSLKNNVENGPAIVEELLGLDGLYRANVGARSRKSKILQFLEERGESTGDSLPEDKNEASKLLTNFDKINKETGLKLKSPQTTATRKTKSAKQERLFNWIFENIPPEKMQEEIQTMFGLGRVVKSDTGEKVVFESITPDSPGYLPYEAFLDNYDMWASAKIAKMLDESIQTGGTKLGKQVVDVDAKDAAMWKEINDKIDQGDAIGKALIKDSNLDLLKKMQAYERATGGKMRIGRKRHFDMLQGWMMNNEKLAEAYDKLLKLSDKIIERRTLKIEESKASQNKVIKVIESKAKGFENLNDFQNFFDYAMRNKQEMKEARNAAIKSGMNSKEWDSTVKRLLIKALIQRRTIGTAKGKIKYESISDSAMADQLSKQNGMDRDKIKKVNVNVKGKEQQQKMLIATHKELDGMGMIEDIEEYGESLAEYFGENSAVLEHFKLIAKLGSFMDMDEAAMKSIKGGKFARGVTLSIPMIQSRLWAIMSKRASYHYALSEGLLAFANGRSLDTAYAFLNADAEVSGAMAKMLATGETKFAAQLDPKLALAFYADTVMGLTELQEGHADYLRSQDPYRKLLNTLFELSPDKSPEGLFPSRKDNNKIFGRNSYSLKDDAQIEDSNLLRNRREYFAEISKRFLEKIKEGPGVDKNITMQDIFNEAFAEYQAQSTTFTP